MLVWTSFLVGAQVLTAGAALGDVVGPKVFGIAALTVAALQAGTNNYTSKTQVPRSESVPRGEVMARQTEPGAPVVSTPAAEAAYGIPAGSVVDVNLTTGSP